MRNSGAAGLLLVLLVGSMLTGAGTAVGEELPPGGTFVDDNGNVHEGWIEAIAGEGITRGCNPPVNDRFCPDGTVTRGEMAAFLARALMLQRPSSSEFVDARGHLFERDMRQVLLGEGGALTARSQREAWQYMTRVVPSQTWGITAGVPDGWTVAQKNGFVARNTNSVGFVQEPGSEQGYVIVVLSTGWSSWEAGIGPVEEVSAWVSGTLAR